MKRVLIAGGLCGTTMLIAADKIKKICNKNNIDVIVNIHNLWESAISGQGYDLIIEMFPYFENITVPLLSGKPFIAHIEEKQLLNEIVRLLS